MIRVFANGPGDQGSYRRLKMVLDTFLLYTQDYKVGIKGKLNNPKRNSTLPYNTV